MLTTSNRDRYIQKFGTGWKLFDCDSISDKTGRVLAEILKDDTQLISLRDKSYAEFDTLLEYDYLCVYITSLRDLFIGFNPGDILVNNVQLRKENLYTVDYSERCRKCRKSIATVLIETLDQLSVKTSQKQFSFSDLRFCDSCYSEVCQYLSNQSEEFINQGVAKTI